MKAALIILGILLSYNTANAEVVGLVENVLPDGTVNGWACDKATPERNSLIRISFSKGRSKKKIVVAQRIASLYPRYDVAEALGCTGLIGFEAKVRPHLFHRGGKLYFEASTDHSFHPEKTSAISKPIEVEFIKTADSLKFKGRIILHDSKMDLNFFFNPTEQMFSHRHVKSLYVTAAKLAGDDAYAGIRYRGISGGISGHGYYLSYKGYEQKFGGRSQYKKMIFEDVELEGRAQIYVSRIHVYLKPVN